MKNILTILFFFICVLSYSQNDVTIGGSGTGTGGNPVLSGVTADDTTRWGQGGGQMTESQINDTLNLINWYTPDDTIPVTHHENYMNGALQITQDTPIVINMSNVYTALSLYHELTFDFKVYNTGSNYKIDAITASDGSQVNTFLTGADSMRTDAYKINRYICSLSEPLNNGTYLIGCKNSVTYDTITIVADIVAPYILSAEVGNIDDSLLVMIASENLLDSISQTAWNFDYGSGTLGFDSLYISNDTIYGRLVSAISADSTCYIDYTQPSDSLVQDQSNNLMASFSDTTVTNNVTGGVSYTDLTWGTYQNAIIDGNTITATSGSCQAQADETFSSDFFVKFDLPSAADAQAAVFGIDANSGMEAYTGFDFGIYNAGGNNVYKIESGTPTLIGSAADGSALGIRRTGTTITYEYAANGVDFSVINTSGGSSSGTAYVKAAIITTDRVITDAVYTE